MNRPYVVMNATISCDGKLTLPSRERFRLSNDKDTAVIDLLRRSSDAILIGATTLEKDNPSLVLRDGENITWRKQQGMSGNPAKVGLSPACKIDTDSNFLRKGDAEKYVYTTNLAEQKDIDRVSELATVVQHDSARVSIPLLLQDLFNRGVTRLLLEGGGSTNFEFLRCKAVDEIRVAIAPCIIGGRTSPTLVDGLGFDANSVLKLNLTEVETLVDIVVLKYKVDYTSFFNSLE